MICRVCKTGELHQAVFRESYFPNKKVVTVELLESKCGNCGNVRTSSAQHDENLRRLAARKSEYEGQLMGEEYIAFRKRYGLTQQQASKIFGKGIIAFSRYENEEFFPDASTRLLIELAITRPEVLKELADKASIAIPLWKERCEDEQRIKVRPILAAAAAVTTTTQEDWTASSGAGNGRQTFKATHASPSQIWESVGDSLAVEEFDLLCERAA